MIGVYDSGVGGLTVLKTLKHLLPEETFIYFGDTLHLPYGNKTPEQIIGYSRDIIDWFQNEMKVKLVVAACNTSSALALDALSHKFEIPLVGTIYPLLQELLNHDIYKNVGIIATEASAKSAMHEKIFKSHGFKGNITTISCPDFVPLIESGNLNSVDLKAAAERYLEPYKALDTLIFGCTHYPFIKDTIRSILPPWVHYIDPADYMGFEVLNILNAEGKLSHEKGQDQYFCSHDSEGFALKIKNLTGEDVKVNRLSPKK